MKHFRSSTWMQDGGSLTITAIYLLTRGLWILLSDSLLARITATHEAFLTLSIYKGWGYVLATGGMLYLLIQNNNRALRKAAQNYSLLAENISDVIWLFDLETMRFTYVSPSIQQLCGLTPDEVMRENPLESTCSPGLKHIFDSFPARLDEFKHDTMRSYTDETEIHRKDGSTVWVEITSRFALNLETGHTEVYGSTRDISARKKTEQALQKSEWRLQVFFNQSLDGFFFCDFEEPIEWKNAPNRDEVLEYIITSKRFTDVNEAMLKQYGISRKDFLNLTTKDVFAHDLEQGRALRRQLFDNGHLHLETYERTSDGTPVWFEGAYVCLYDSEGRVTGFFGIQRDITERKQAESELRRYVRNTATMYELSRQIHSGLDLDRAYQDAHQAAGKLMPCDAFVIALLDEANQEIEDVYLWDRDKRFKGKRYPAGEDLTGYVISSAKPLRVNEWNETRGQMTSAVRFGYSEGRILSMLAVPLFGVDGSCFGMMSAQCYEANAFTAEHEQLLVTLASHVSKAIENANLFARAQEELAERKRAEQALTVAEEKYRSIFENALYGIYQSSPEGRFLTVNPALARMLGYDSPQEMTGTITDIAGQVYVVPSRRAEFMRLMAEHGQVSRFEYQMLRKDGSAVWVSENARTIHDDGGGILYYEGMVEDITERRRSEEALRESEQNYRTLFEHLPIPVFTKSRDGHYTSSNEENLKYWKTNPIGHTDEELSPSKAARALREADLRVMESGVSITVEEYLADTPMGERQVLTRKVPLHDNNGNITGILGASLDITERKQMEDALKRSEAFARSIVDNEPECVKIVEKGGKLQYMNPAGLAMIEVEDLEKVRGKSVYPIVAAEHRDAFIALTERVLQGESGTLLFEMVGLKGTRRWLDTHAVPLLDNEGNVTALLGITRDVTERIRTEQQAREQLNRLNALHTIDTVIKSSVDLNGTLDILLNQVVTQLGVDAASILLFNKDSLTLNFSAGRGFRSTATQHTRLKPGEGFAGRIILERRITHIPDLAKAEGKLIQALSLAGENFVAYVGVPLIAKGQIVGVLEIFQRSQLNPNQDWFGFLEMLADQAAIAIDNAQLFENLQRSNFELTLAYDATIEGWSRALDLRDKETEGHTQRVTSLTMLLARQMGIPDSEILHIRRGALLHDIGKMGVPDHILHKPGKLTEEEWVIMRKHPIYASDMLMPITHLRPALDIPHCHHEKWDGTGYPQGLVGEQIPMAARLFAVVDVWDALRSDRPYRKGWTFGKTRKYIIDQSGKHFDPQVVNAFLKLLEDMPRLFE